MNAVRKCLMLTLCLALVWTSAAAEVLTASSLPASSIPLNDSDHSPDEQQSPGQILYVDPRYGYQLTVPASWTIYPTAANALFGVAMLYNFDPDLVEQEAPLPTNSLQIQIGSGTLNAQQSLDNWLTSRIKAETSFANAATAPVQASLVRRIKIGQYSGVVFLLDDGDSMPVLEFNLMSEDQILSIGVMPVHSDRLTEALSVLATLDMGPARPLACKTCIPDKELTLDGKPSSQVIFTKLVSELTGSISASVVPDVAEAECTGGMGSYPGDEAPDSPIPLWMPFREGQAWQVGGVGAFYGRYCHTNMLNAYYATDWNIHSANVKEYGAPVLPMAPGTISDAVSPTCPTKGLGCVVQVDHGAGIRTVYAHLSNVFLSSGPVKRWDEIGAVGGSGGWPTHLHVNFLQYAENPETEELDYGYYSRCFNNGLDCPNGDASRAPQTAKPSPMWTSDGLVSLQDYGVYTSTNDIAPPLGIVLYEHESGGGREMAYPLMSSSSDWYRYQTPDSLLVSSIGIAQGWGVVVRGGLGPVYPLCRVFDTSVSNLADYAFEDGSVINDQVQEVEVFRGGGMCVSTCGFYGERALAAAGSGTTSAAQGGICGGTNPPPASCPQSGGVLLYQHASFNCDNQNEGRGYVRAGEPGLSANVGPDFNDRASSIRVPPGWSVKLYQHENGLGGSACRNSDDPDFWGDRLSNGVPLNDNVTSFEVFSAPNCGENHVPNIPSLQNPNDGYVAREGRAPTLCWNNSGDLDGDAVSFYAEAHDSAVSANSGWSSSRCWRPSELDGRYYNYQWRVKARDSRGSESDWSSTWHFTVEAPDEPPSISFGSANGQDADQVISRDRNWTFIGTASDPEGQLDRIDFRCSGDNCGTQASHTNGTSWSHAQSEMAGQNDIYFVAYDALGQATASRHLDLRIDLAPPDTTLSVNSDANPANWPPWFTVPLQVRLDAGDNATGRALSGVREAHYRLDGGVWQVQVGDAASFEVSNDGVHTIEYYAADNAGNAETSHSTTFRMDRTPPSPPSGVVETNGVPTDQWQKAQNTPTFTWAASSDATSGVWGYQFYFGPDPAGISYQTFLAADPRQWTPQPGGVRTGTYYLRGRTRDNAGNWTSWTPLYIYRYDGTPPENPESITHAAGVANDTWQRTSNVADFAWPIPHDEGSNIKGYNVYWGVSQDGTSTDFITANAYQSSTPLCGANEACVGYLRLRSMDKVDTPANDWATAFTLRYDNAPPVAAFSFSEGITTTQTLVHLQIAATDQGSGLREMRLSDDGQNWWPWEVSAAEREWRITAISRRWWSVYLQVRDGVGLTSEVISHTIYLDVNPRQPRSASFRLFDHAMTAGSGEHSSTDYNGRSTLGQAADSARASSLNYSLVGGYQAGSQAIPIVEPGHDAITLTNGIFASGTGATTLTSLTYRMAGTLGELGLPNGETTLVSQNHQHQPGFLAAVRPAVTPTSTPIPGPTPTPSPTPACTSPSVKINGDTTQFTYSLDVTLDLCAPWATEMLVSSDKDFAGATWEPYARSKSWTLTPAGQDVQPCFVYAAFKDAQGTVYTNYFDDITYDPNPPIGGLSTDENAVPGTVLAGSSRLAAPGADKTKHIEQIGETLLAHPLALLAPQSDGTVDLYVNAQDDNSGLAQMQISASGTFTDTDWEPYSALKPWTPEGGDGIKTVYARFRDSAGNVSAPADASFALDTLPPLGGIAIGTRVIGPDVVTSTVYFGAEDNLSGVADMRVSEDPTLTDAAWLPYTPTLTWPMTVTETSQGALYAQYRDLAGNVSEVYSDTYTVDAAPPAVYVEVAPGENLTRAVNVYAYDELADLGVMHMSNDPLMVKGVVTVSYTPTVTWEFDGRRVVWVQLSDSVGNWTEPYPAYAAPVLAPESPVAAVGLEDGRARLTWAHLDANAYYQVWRDTKPYFDPAVPTTDTVKLDDIYPLGGGEPMTYLDVTADSSKTYYYVVIGVNALGQASATKGSIGVFRFGLTPGQ